MGYELYVKKPIELLASLLELLCGNARLSLEGDLSRVDLTKIPGVSRTPSGSLKRNTISPQQEFIIVPVEDHAVVRNLRRNFPRIGLKSLILHILIEKDGELAFAAYDQFYGGKAWVSDRIGKSFLESLQEKGIIKSFIKE
jgi:hypothetical protein